MQHGVETYKKVTDAIEKISKFQGSKVSILMSISKINYLEATMVAEYARKLNVQVDFQFVCSIGKAKDNKELLELTPYQKASTFLKLNEYSNIHPEMGIIAPKTLLSCSFSLENIPFALNINIDGDIVTCSCFDSKFSIGNIYESSVEDILNSPKIEEIHNRVIKRKEVLKKTVCQNCIVSFRCQQGCIGRAINLGDENGVDGECDFRRVLMLVNKFLKFKKDEQLR